MKDDHPHEQYKRFLNRLAHVVAALLVPKIAMYDYFTVEFAADPSGTRGDVPLLYYLVEALETDVVLSLAKLVEARSDSNLLKLINFAQTHRTRIEWRTAISDAELTEQKAALRKQQTTIDAIMAQRNRYYAHADRRYFFDPGARHEDHPISNGDLIELTRTIQRILGSHLRHLEGSGRVSLDAFFYSAADQMLSELRTAAAQRQVASERTSGSSDV